MKFSFSRIKYPYFIAEISANHDGSIKDAKKLILSAKKNGASAIKLQTYTPDTITINSNRKEFLIKHGLWKGYNLWNLYQKAHTPFEWHKELFQYAKSLQILCFSTPFDETAVDLLEELNCPIYKIASPEIMHFPLLKKISKTKKPLIISTGMASLKEIDASYNYAKKLGIKQISLLYCVSSYPAKSSDFNINNIKILKKNYNCIIGFSDHSIGTNIAEAAVFAGAEIIEKHICLKSNDKSLDSSFSISGKEIKIYKQTLDNAYKLLGKKYFYRNKSEKKNLIFRRSIYTLNNIKKGERFTKYNIKVIRPALGASPLYYDRLINKISATNIKKFSPINRNILKKLKIIK